MKKSRFREDGGAVDAPGVRRLSGFLPWSWLFVENLDQAFAPSCRHRCRR